jgi:hypothetical protein
MSKGLGNEYESKQNGSRIKINDNFDSDGVYGLFRTER